MISEKITLVFFKRNSLVLQGSDASGGQLDQDLHSFLNLVCLNIMHLSAQMFLRVKVLGQSEANFMLKLLV